MVFGVSILVKNCDAVFEWTQLHIPATSLVRQVARGVNYQAWKAGAIYSVCPRDHPNAGWVVKTIMKHRDIADYFLSTWKPQVERCDFDVFGDEDNAAQA